MQTDEGKLIAENMPKLQSPYKREQREINGSKYYVVKDEIDPDYMWVFEDPEVYAMEKLDGTNVSVVMEKGEMLEVWNRKNKAYYEKTWVKGFDHIKLGIENSLNQITDLLDGQHFGELIGLGIQKNPMDIPDKKWVPFKTFGNDKLVYNEWKHIQKNFDSISDFMKNLKSKYYALNHDGKEEYAEGIVLYRPSTGDRAKLRRDMFDWWIIDNPGVINKHINTYNKAPKKKQPEGMQGEFSILSKKFKQNLISKDDFESEKKKILSKYGIQ